MNKDAKNMTREELEAELHEFRTEKERVRGIVGQIGGKKTKNLDAFINIVFLSIVFLVFFSGAVFHFIDYTLSLEIGVLLVSLKIAWMIRKQEKVNHFQFWVLTALEYKQNEISKKTKNLENIIKILHEKHDKHHVSVNKF